MKWVIETMITKNDGSKLIVGDLTGGSTRSAALSTVRSLVNGSTVSDLVNSSTDFETYPVDFNDDARITGVNICQYDFEAGTLTDTYESFDFTG